jgi:glutathione S-transferase
MNPMSSNSDTIVQEITIKGSAERIFEALTNPDQRIKWWGTEGRFQTTHMESDLRLGGKWMMRGIGIGGKPFTVGGEYQQIEPPRLLVFTWLPDWQEDATESIVRFDLQENGGVTTVRLTHSGLESESSRVSHKGWPQILTWLQAYVERQLPRN